MNARNWKFSICDYVDGTLDSRPHKAEVESHLAECEACAELARDAAEAVRFMERAAEVEPPPELMTRILFDAPWRKGANRHRARAAGSTGSFRPCCSRGS